jgi:hypothetical protein
MEKIYMEAAARHRENWYRFWRTFYQSVHCVTLWNYFKVLGKAFKKKKDLRAVSDFFGG